jgi:hypothetical protein
MRCLINQLIELNSNKKKSTPVLLRYLRVKYRINLSREVLERRMSSITPPKWKLIG